MFIKILGSVMVVASTVAFSFYLAMEYKYRIWCLDELKTAIQIFKAEMIYSAPRLGEIFDRVSKNTTYEVGRLFSMASYHLENKDGENSQCIWERVLDEAEFRYLTSDDIRNLKEFGKSFGQPLKESQLQSADILSLYIDEKREEARLKEEKNSKILKSAGVLLGALIVIVLV